MYLKKWFSSIFYLIFNFYFCNTQSKNVRFPSRTTNLVGELVILQQTQGHHSGGLVTALHVLDELLYVPELGRHFRMIFLISALLVTFRLGLVVRALLLGLFTDQANPRAVSLAGDQTHLRFRGRFSLGCLRDFFRSNKERAYSDSFKFSTVYNTKTRLLVFVKLKNLNSFLV